LLAVVVGSADGDVVEDVGDGGVIVGGALHPDLSRHLLERVVHLGSPAQTVGGQEVGLSSVGLGSDEGGECQGDNHLEGVSALHDSSIIMRVDISRFLVKINSNLEDTSKNTIGGVAADLYSMPRLVWIDS
jgi:hypothetical protein